MRDEAVRNRLFSGENAKRSPKEKAGLLSERHDQYTQLMALNCIKPMAQGIDASTLTEAVSTAAVMWALSPRFRELMADYNTKINDALRVTRSKNLDNNTRVPLGSSRETVEAAQTTAQREDKAMLDQVAAVLKGAESVPFSTEAAAMSLLQIHEDAYVAMREGEDPDAVTASLKETVDELNDIWKSQKLDPQLVTATARTLAGRTDGVEDLRLAQFVETAGGSVRPSQQSVVTGSGGAAVASWGGQWSMAAGKLLDSARSRMFEVRRVADARSHQDSLSTLVFQDLALASKAGPAELRKAVIGHLASWELRDYNLDPSGIGGASRDRSVACAQRSRVAYAAMADDGIDEGIRQTVASNALMNGMKAFETAEPEAVALMSKQFGDSHSEAVAELVARGRERGKHVPVRPLIFEPVNREHAAKMVGQPAAPSEQARELGTEAPRPSALAPWGPRAHPDVLAAERTNRQGGEALAPRRVVNVARPQSVRRGVDRREPLDRTSVATPGRSVGTERQDQAPTRSESPRTPTPEHPRQGRTSEPIRAEHTVGRHARRDEASAGAPAPAWTPPTSSAPRSPWEPGPDVAGVGKGLRPQPEKRATPPALGGNAAKATNREVGPEPTT